MKKIYMAPCAEQSSLAPSRLLAASVVGKVVNVDFDGEAGVKDDCGDWNIWDSEEEL